MRLDGSRIGRKRDTIEMLGIGVDLAGILRGTHGERRRWVGAEWVGYGEGCPLSSRLGGLGERRELPQRGPGQSPGRKRILAYCVGHRTLLFVSRLYDKNLRGTICTSVPYSKFWGDLSSRPP